MKVTLILLAAGNSRRFHGNKLLHDFHGKPMVQYIADEVNKLPEGLFDRRLIVTQYEEIMVYMNNCGYEVVENRDSHLGISHSIHLAVNRTKEDRALCFAVCDQPYLKAETLEGFMKGWEKSKKGIGCLCSKKELGNPAVFSPMYRQELLKLRGDKGGKQVIRCHRDDLYVHQVEDERELMDIDVPIRE